MIKKNKWVRVCVSETRVREKKRKAQYLDGSALQTKKVKQGKYEKTKRSRWGSNPRPSISKPYARLLPLGWPVHPV